MNIHAVDLTPSQRDAIEHRRTFRQTIAAKAAELAERKTRMALAAISIAALETPLSSVPQVIEGATNGWFAIIDDLGPRVEPSIALIQKICCSHFGLRKNEFLSARRTADFVYARQVGMFIAKKLTSRSLPEIGRRFGNRDHTTVLYAVRKIGIQSKRDPEIACDIDVLIAEIERFSA